MSDVEEPEEDFEPKFQPGVVQKLEVDLLTAIANDHEATYDYPVTVASYLLVAEVISESGELEMMWTTTDGTSPQAMLGLAHWLLKRVDEIT